MDTPTHKDAFLSLLSSCFPCRSSPPALPPSPRLDALLRPPSTDLESDNDAMSLHSMYRLHTRRKQKKKSQGVMQMCGVNLFGKSRGQIRLEDDDDDEPQQQQRAGFNQPQPRPRPRYDSDAAPLPDSTIHSLSISRSNTATATSPTSPTTTEQPTRKPESPEEELARLRAEKAARKARRKDRRERKARRQLALEHTGSEFEGYIGSGVGVAGDGFPISPPSTTTSTPGIEEAASTRGGEDERPKMGVDDADPEDVEADMGAGVYTHSSSRSGIGSGSSSGTGTGTGTTSLTGRTNSSGRRVSLGPVLSANNALGLGIQRGPGPFSPLAQSHVPTPIEAQVVASTLSETPAAGSKTASECDSIANQSDSKLSSSSGEQDRPRLRPKIHISGLAANSLPMSSPGAGPGPRTMEHSPRLAHIPSLSGSPKLGSGAGFPSPGLGGPNGLGFPSPGLGKSNGLASAGLARFLRPGSVFQVLGLAAGVARGEAFRLGMDPRARAALQLGWGSRLLIGATTKYDQDDEDSDNDDD